MLVASDNLTCSLRCFVIGLWAMYFEDAICLGTCDCTGRCSWIVEVSIPLTFWRARAWFGCFISAKAMYNPMSRYYPNRQELQLTKCCKWVHGDLLDSWCQELAYPLSSSLDPTLQGQWFGTNTLYPGDMWHSEAPKQLWCYCRSKEDWSLYLTFP